MLEGEALFVEILDTCPKSLEELPGEDVMDWADGVVLVYSVTDRESFNYVRRVKNLLKPQTPMTLVGNKIDVIHLRQVSTEEGDICAKDFECSFFEVSAAEQVVEIIKMFRELCHEIMATRRRAKYSLFDRMLGNKPCRVYARGKSDSALPKQ